MELTGRVVRVLPIASGTSQQGNQWQKQEFIFGFYENPSDIYERNIKLDLMNERIEKYKLAENDQIKVRIALSCREYPQGSGKYFNDIRTGDITIIKKLGTEGAQQPAQAENNPQANNQPQQQNNAPTGDANGEGGTDDLPF